MLSLNIKTIPFLAGYYTANLLKMKLMGRQIGHRFWRDKAHWERLLETLPKNDTWLIVGNGPSLSAKDLEILSEFPSIASNKINLLFPATIWRPTLYTIADPLLLYKLDESHFADFDKTLLPSTHGFICRAKRQLRWRHLDDDEAYDLYEDPGNAINPETGFFVGRTITCCNIQLAIWAGAKRILLIGCDHSYKQEGAISMRSQTVHIGGADHFVAGYRKKGEIVNSAPIDLMNAAFQNLERFSRQRGVRIINISRKTALDAFEKSSIENVLREARSPDGGASR